MVDPEHRVEKEQVRVRQDVHVSGGSVGDIIGQIGRDYIRGNKIVISLGGGAVLVALVVFLLATQGGIPVVLPPTPPPAPPTPTPLAFAPAGPGEALIILAPYSGRLKQAEVFPERYVRDQLQKRASSLGRQGYAVRIEPWMEPVDTAGGARAIGQAYRASLVVWGEFDDVGGIRTLIEVMEDIAAPELEQAGDWLAFSPFPPAEQSTGSVLRECLTVAAPRQADYLVLVSLGIVALARADAANAEQFFTDAIDAVSAPSTCHTDARGAYYWRGLARRRLEQYARAVEDLDRAVTLDARSRNALGERGLARFVLGDTDGALADMNAALAATEANDLHVQGIVLGNLGIIYDFRGDPNQAGGAYQRALAAARQTGDKAGEAINLARMGNQRLLRSDFDSARDYYAQALALYETLTDARGRAAASAGIGTVYELRDELDTALDWYGKSRALYANLSDRQGEATILLHLGSVAQRKQQWDAAAQYDNQALALCQSIGYRACQAVALGNMGLVLYQKNDAAAALANFQAALSIDRAIGYAYGAAKQWTSIGLAQTRTDPAAARDAYGQALTICRQLDCADCQARALVGAGLAAAKQGDRQAAVENLKEALALFETIGRASDAAAVRNALNQLGQ